jgi:hypothetical protein
MKQPPKVYLTAGLLVLGFLALCAWFRIVDVYHRHFFDAGILDFAYNISRVVFLGFFAVIVCALGYVMLRALKAAGRLSALTTLEKLVLAFGVGIGALHAIMLALGVLGLYYAPLMIGLCLILLVVAAPLLVRALRRFSARRALGFSPIAIATIAALGIAAAWLLTVKGLYPGGGGDYYTHYFYYYLQVLQNHGLQPNDVWYHYYYSKGAGPTFLGMLLTDPEAPALITYGCVIFAAIAVTTLSARLAPKSLWPALAGSLYLLSYIVPLSDAIGGEFQKPHEETSALIVLAAWTLCMRLIGPLELERPCLIMAAAVLAAAATLELAASVLFGVFLGVAAAWAFIRNNRRDARIYALLAAFAVVVTAGILLLNYAVTGLATDQALSFMLRFANLERLNKWGLIPQIILIAWIRDNYALLAPGSFRWEQIADLRDYLRLDYLWILIVSGFIALGIHPMASSTPESDPMAAPAGPEVTGTEIAVTLLLLLGATLLFRDTLTAFHIAGVNFTQAGVALIALGSAIFTALQIRWRPKRDRPHEDEGTPRRNRSVLTFLGALIGTLAVISVPAAGSQAVSYLRFSGFFLPLVILFAVACWGMCTAAWRGHSSQRLVAIVAPALIFFLVLVSWQVSTSWLGRATAATKSGLRFFAGNYALAEAYHHQSSGLPYGGIKPGALAAMQHVPRGARIWSTNVDSYCMAPGCIIESSVSFKLSSHLNEILNDSPEHARAILRSERLNYFFFSKDAANGIIDPLPYSRLFNPNTIDAYFGIQWTNGTDFLLTWRSPETEAIGPSFTGYYRAALSGSEHPWFRFRELLPQMKFTMTTLETSPHPWRRLDFAWERSASAKGVKRGPTGSDAAQRKRASRLLKGR